MKMGLDDVLVQAHARRLLRQVNQIPGQDLPQTLLTSLTQMESHVTLQQ